MPTWRPPILGAIQAANPGGLSPTESRNVHDNSRALTCKRLIKNCIICWNYLYLSQKPAETDGINSREALLQAVDLRRYPALPFARTPCHRGSIILASFNLSVIAMAKHRVLSGLLMISQDVAEA
jgi:hypothetical protein